MLDEELLDGIRKGTWEPLDIPSEIIRVDTSKPFNHSDVVEEIRRFNPANL